MSTSAAERPGATFMGYITSLDRHWDDTTAGRREKRKITDALEAIRTRDGVSTAECINAVFAAAERRSASHPRTVHVGGRGGSGSHWLAGMLDSLGPFADIGEVILPRAMRREMASWPIPEQALLLDAVHLLHALPTRPDAEGLSFVNSNGTVDYISLKRSDPTCVFVHLIRDPRDQCVSVSYRKPLARALYPTSADEEGDEEFLRLMIYRNRASMLRPVAAPVPPDLVVRYEDLRRDPRPALLEIAAIAEATVTTEDAKRVAFEHRAENMQAGLSPHRGNLYQGPRRTWREATSVRQRQFLHAGLADIIDMTRYPLDDCLGESAALAGLDETQTITFAPGVVLGEFHGRSSSDDNWQRLGPATGAVTLHRGLSIRLRSPGGWTSSLRHLAEMPADTLASLCLAGNLDVRDADLATLSGQRSLQEIDLSRTHITDRALAYLDELPNLRGLGLLHCAITPSAVAQFARAHPDCRVVSGQLWSEEWRPRGWLNDRFIP